MREIVSVFFSSHSLSVLRQLQLKLFFFFFSIVIYVGFVHLWCTQMWCAGGGGDAFVVIRMAAAMTMANVDGVRCGRLNVDKPW